MDRSGASHFINSLTRSEKSVRVQTTVLRQHHHDHHVLSWRAPEGFSSESHGMRRLCLQRPPMLVLLVLLVP